MNKKVFGTVAAAIIIFLGFRFLLPLVIPFVLAWFFAKTLAPTVHFFTERCHWNKKISSVLVVSLVTVALISVAVYIISLVISQASLLLQRLPVYGQYFSNVVEGICYRCDRMLELASGTSFRYVESQAENMYQNVSGEVLPKLSSQVVSMFKWGANAIGGVFMFFLATLLILMEDSFPVIHQKIRPFVNKLKVAGLAYIKAQGIIIFINAAVMSLGFIVMKNEYALLLGAGIALFDAFPIVGSGMILIPWAIIKICSGDFWDAAILATIFVIATFLREVLEPRLFGKEVGLKPLYVLIAVYTGIQLWGVAGIVLGPIALTVLKTVKESL